MNEKEIKQPTEEKNSNDIIKLLEQIEENQATMIQLLCDLLNKTE